jgi:large subunit ribosomal protein L6
VVMTNSSPNGGANAHSRIGKRPIVVPSGVDVKLNGAAITVKGPKGSLERTIPPEVSVEIKDNIVNVIPVIKSIKDGKRVQGLIRALISNMVDGVSKGYSNTMDLHGVGYRIDVKGQEIVLALGFSHQIPYALPDGINAVTTVVDEGGVKRQRLVLNSHDKQLLGQTVAKIRSLKPPEPYGGKGFRIKGERIREKAGKTGAKTA